MKFQGDKTDVTALVKYAQSLEAELAQLRTVTDAKVKAAFDALVHCIDEVDPTCQLPFTENDLRKALLAVTAVVAEDHPRKKRARYVDGLFDAMLAFGEITGPMKMDDMQEQTWKLICETNIRLLRMIQDQLGEEG